MSHQQSTIVLPLSQPSFRSYLLQALLAWCEDEGYTPYILVSVDDATLVPREFVTQDGTIVLCVASEATHQFEITHDSMHFQARFGEKIHTIDVPLGRISALYPKENPTSSVISLCLRPLRGRNRKNLMINRQMISRYLPSFNKIRYNT